MSGDVRSERPPRPPLTRRPAEVPTPAGAEAGVEGNSRLTGATAAVLFVLLAAEGVTVLQVRSLLRPHVIIGMLLVPPLVLKIASTGWRFLRYYSGAPAYRHKGPPPWLLRMIGPAVIALSVVVLGSGIGLLYAGSGWHDRLLTLHKASFVLWFGATAIHVLGHLVETPGLAAADLSRRARRAVPGGFVRLALVGASLAAGGVLAWVVVAQVSTYLAGRPVFFG